MNAKRIVLGGLLAGLAMNVLDMITNGVVFGAAWRDAYTRLGLDGENVGVPLFWLGFDFFAGLLIAWLYAALLPRFGAGVRTAIYAAAVEWLMLHLTIYSHLVDGVFPARVVLGVTLPEAISAVVGGLIARKLYREAGTATGEARAAA